MIRACPRPMKLTARVACKSMNCAQEQKHLAQANGHIAELTVQIVRQRVIVKYALDTDQPLEMAESLLRALEQSRRAFEKHRELIFDRLKCQIQTPPDPPDGAIHRRAGVCHDANGVRHDWDKPIKTAA